MAVCRAPFSPQLKGVTQPSDRLQSNQGVPFPLCLETLKDQNNLVTEEVTERSLQRKLKYIDFKVYFKSSKIKQVEARLAAVLYFYAYGEERHMTSSQF